jgi:hypothetical protein
LHPFFVIAWIAHALVIMVADQFDKFAADPFAGRIDMSKADWDYLKEIVGQEYWMSFIVKPFARLEERGAFPEPCSFSVELLKDVKADFLIG